MGLNTDGRSKLPVHQFQAIAAEWRRGSMTGAQAATALGLNANEQAEAQAIVNTVPTGTTTANRLDRLEKQQAIDQVLLIAEMRIAPLDTPQAVRTRLGI